MNVDKKRNGEGIEYNGLLWKIYQGVLVPDVAPHEKVNLPKQDAIKLIKRTKAYFIRWTTDFDSKTKYPFWYVIKDEGEDGDLKKYPSKIRSEIRRGLRNNNVELVSSVSENLISQLYEVYLNAFRRYKVLYVKPLTFEVFRRNIITYNKGDIWIVTNKQTNKIVAYCLTEEKVTRNGSVVNYSVIKLHPDYLKGYPSYALVYEMNRYYLNEKNALYVHDGTRSLGHETNVHDWLMKKFKFRKAYVQLHVEYRNDVFYIVKVLYPLRKIFYKLESKNSFAKKITILLRHEDIKQECEKILRNNRTISDF